MKRTCILLFFILCLSLLTCQIQFQRLGIDYILNREYKRQHDVFNGTAGAPIQYRPFSSWIIVGAEKNLGFLSQLPVDKLLHSLTIPKEKLPFLFICITLKTMQYFLIFLLFFFLFGKFLSAQELGLALLSLFYCLTRSFYNEGINFYQHFDLIFFMTGFLLVKAFRKEVWLIPVMIVGALNKETILLFPFVYLFLGLKNRKPMHFYRVLALLIFGLLTSFCVRELYGFNLHSRSIVPVGWQMAWYNITNPWTYINGILFFNILFFFSWTGEREIKRYLFSTLLVFLPILLFFARLDEVRLFMVFVIFIIPLSIKNIRRLYGTDTQRLP